MEPVWYWPSRFNLRPVPGRSHPDTFIHIMAPVLSSPLFSLHLVMQKMFFLLACFFTCADCSPQQYSFVQYTPNDGLVNSRVRRVCQDSQGRMYFITYAGLSVYDGTRFVNYTRQEGLANDVINDVLEIGDDTILVATNTNKVNVLVHGRVGTYPVDDNYFPIVNRFLKSSDGRIYAASDDGLFLLTGHNFERLPVEDKQGTDIGHYFDKIVEWKNYFLLIPWDDRIEKLILYDRANRKTADTYASRFVVSTKVDRSNNVWLATYNGIKLLDTISLQQGKIKLKNASAEYAAVKNNEVRVPFFDSRGSTWLYSGNDISKISPQGFQQIISPEHGLKAASVLDLFEDREGIIWMATDGSGVIKMRGSNIQVISSLSPDFVFSAFDIQQQADTVWIYNRSDNSVLRLYNNAVKKFQLPANNKPGSLYLQDNKIYMVNNKKITSIADKNDPKEYGRPVTVTNTRPGAVLGCSVADKSGGFIQLITVGDSAFFLDVYKNNKWLSETRISFMTDRMIIDHQGRLWIAPRDNHVSVFTIHPGEPGNYLQLLKDYAKELPDMGPRSLAEDKQGNIWIGTRYNGVYRLELSGLQLVSVKQFTTHDGLTDNFIYSMACDNNNVMWVGTQSGLDKIFLKGGHYVISNVSKSNGFFQAIRQIVITNDNTLWGLTSEATILKVEQTSPRDSLAAPALLLSLLEVNNDPVNELSSTFSYHQNNFTFNVAAPSFLDEKSIRYSYRLEGGGNANWSTASHNPFLAFSNLSPGNYILHAKAFFPDATYPPREASYTFIILPPWWKTLLFRLLTVCIAISLLIVGTRSYYRRKLRQQKTVLERQQAIEKERTRIATDMHDDLGAGLSRIKFLSETIGIKKQQQLPIEEDISKIREYSHEMIDKMGEIVWALNEKNDSLSDLLSYTRSYAVEYLSQNGVGCTVHSPEQLSSAFVSGEFRRNVFLAVKEILHNVVKHSQANHVKIEMNVNHDLFIQIQDNGTGFDRAGIRPFSNGLHNIEKRMKDIGGTVDIQSAKGTAIRLNIPLLS